MPHSQQKEINKCACSLEPNSRSHLFYGFTKINKKNVLRLLSDLRGSILPMLVGTEFFHRNANE